MPSDLEQEIQTALLKDPVNAEEASAEILKAGLQPFYWGGNDSETEFAQASRDSFFWWVLVPDMFQICFC